MTEMFFEEILQLAYEKEFSEFNNVPEHIFSRQHNRKMKHIFKLYEKAQSSSRAKPVQLKKKLLVAAIAIFAAVILAVTAVGIATNGFKFEQHTEYTKALAVGWESAPTEIKDLYGIDVPKGFVIINNDSLTNCNRVNYESALDSIVFTQRVKKGFDVLYNTEDHELGEVMINGHLGFYIDLEDSCILVWDNGDYVLEIWSTLSKTEVLNLSKTTKLKE